MKSIIILLGTLLSSCALMEKYKTVIKPDKFEQMKVSVDNTPIADEFKKSGAYDIFKSELCLNIGNDICTKKYGETAWARMRVKYSYASEDSIVSFCSAYPVECKNPYYLERLFATKHNEGVDLLKKETLEREESQNRERTSRALSAFAQGYRQQEIDRQNNAPVQTNCYTDGFGNTRCTSSK